MLTLLNVEQEECAMALASQSITQRLAPSSPGLRIANKIPVSGTPISHCLFCFVCVSFQTGGSQDLSTEPGHAEYVVATRGPCHLDVCAKVGHISSLHLVTRLAVRGTNTQQVGSKEDTQTKIKEDGKTEWRKTESTMWKT